MKKEKTYRRTWFSADVLGEAIARFESIASKHCEGVGLFRALSVQMQDAEWHFDSMDEFLSELRGCNQRAGVFLIQNKCSMSVGYAFGDQVDVSVQAPLRSEIVSVFEVFERNLATAVLPPDPPPMKSSPVVFIGHGRNTAWRELKDHLRDKHGVVVESYETGARAGHSIRDILEEMVAKSSFAVLVLTAEDQGADGNYRARQNVIHEAGLFQGKLGFARAILLLEEGVEKFSNVQGVQYIPFSKGNIKETFGEVLATLRREFH